jgi:Ras-related protein Rap-1B
MKTGQGFLLVFSITSMSSLYELAELREQIRRIKEDGTLTQVLSQHHLTWTDRVPMVLVGNKSDLEDDRAVPRARAFKTSQEWGEVPYYEASARRRANVDEVFVDLCRQIIHKDQREYKALQADRRRQPRPGGGGTRRTQRPGHRRPKCTIL